MVQVFKDTFGRGEEITLLPEIARYKVKLSDNPSLHKDSPRTPKAPKYVVNFSPGPELKKALIVDKNKDKVFSNDHN